jgi:hypothetical protein
MASTNVGHNPEESGARLLHFVKQAITNPPSPPVFENAQAGHFDADHVAIFIHGRSSYASTA